MKRFFLFILILCFYVPLLQAGTGENIDNMLGQAYQLVINGQSENARSQFASAAELRLQNQNDRGIIESIRGLYLLGDQETAMSYAARVLEASSSWRAVCGVGYLYASIKGKGPEAGQAFFRSYKLASNTGDWMGMAESGKALYRIGKVQEGSGCLDAAVKVAELQKSYRHMDMLAKAYREIGEDSKAAALERSIQANISPKVQVIDALPAEDRISEESQRNISEQAARDIQADENYITEKMRIQEEKHYQNWNICVPWFSYLLFDVSDHYGYDGLVPNIVIAPGLIMNWANNNISHYNRSGSGLYLYIR